MMPLYLPCSLSLQYSLARRICMLIISLVLVCASGCASRQGPELSAQITAPTSETAISPLQQESSAADLHTTLRTTDSEDALNDDYDEYDDEYEDDYEEEDPGSHIADPLEPFNRVMFTFNDKLYFWVLKPTASVYASIFPQQFRHGIHNVFYNLAFPIRFVSSVLQFKFGKAATEIGCFAVNTTLGIGGLVKVSDHIKPLQDVSPEDLGQTLAHYGVGDGFYIVWPVFGPSTLRDSTGKVGEYFLDPINYIDDWEIVWALKAGKTINYTSLHPEDYDDLKEAAFDPYEALKDFYLQYHRHLVRE